MGFSDLAVVAGFVAAYGLVSRRLERVAITPIMVFTGFGLLTGPEALDVVHLELDTTAARVLIEVTLVLVLFTDAARIDTRILRRSHELPIRMLTVALPLTVLAGVAVSLALFGDLGFWTAALIAAVLAPTDAALAQVVVSSPTVPVRVRQAINVDSGLNDGIVLPLVTVLAALAAGEQIDAARFLVEQLGIGVPVGVGVGALGGWAIARASAHEWMSESFQQLATFAVALAAFATATTWGGNGFVAAFVGGIAFGFLAREACSGVYSFAEEEGHLLTLLVFMVFGGAVLGPRLDDLTWEIALYAVASLTVIRMVPVALSLVGLGLHRETVAFLAWFGPRGLASILFALLIVEEAAPPGASQVLLVASWTVLVSIVAHGLSALPASRWYGRHVEALARERRDLAETVDVPQHPLRR